LACPEVPRIPDGLLGSQPAEGVTWVTCLVIEVAAFEDRSHVRCSNGQGGGTASLPPEFIAVDIRANPGLASSLVTGGARARSARAGLAALIHNNPRNNPPGCDAGNCRGAFGFFVE
jgi:hypothetical protein